MKTINITFEDEEFKKLNDTKERVGMSWHDFLIALYHIHYEAEKKTRRKKNNGK